MTIGQSEPEGDSRIFFEALNGLKKNNVLVGLHNTYRHRYKRHRRSTLADAKVGHLTNYF